MIDKDSEKYKIKLDADFETQKVTREQRRKEYKELKAKIDADREARRIAREKERKSYEASREVRGGQLLTEREEKFARIAAEKDVWSATNHAYSDAAKQRVEAERQAWLEKETAMREERQRTIERLQAKLASGQELSPMEKFELNSNLSQAKLDEKKLKKDSKKEPKKVKDTKKESKKEKDKKVKVNKKAAKQEVEIEDPTDDLFDSIDKIMADDE